METYPTDTTSYLYTYNKDQTISEWVSEIIIKWYREFLRGETKRESTESVFNAHPMITSDFLYNMENYLKNRNINIIYDKIFTTDYEPEGVLNEIYKSSCNKFNIDTSSNNAVVFPVKWLVFISNNTLYIT